ncbi:uncharacterized protein LOC123700841 [Colias croceus]|uniref:uncharacterized protein LOC123700841 n=1 Tax=Colias crocea TaxID=72248 RepID=UPI001E27DD34|nr:uncharacterized protein LOC123700841 [Colias croceus]
MGFITNYTPHQIFLLSLLIPYPTKQHFIWPLHWCLLADICNHTWIPECGAEDEEPTRRRLFTDECDMYEYNCDYERDFEPINYSDCFNIRVTCPIPEPCPSIPPCPNHRLHKVGNKYKYVKAPFRRAERRIRTTNMPLPRHMLHGKRRYTPTRHTHTPTKPKTAKKTVSKTKASFTTVILKKEEVIKNGRRMMKIVKQVIKKMTLKKVTQEYTKDSDFLE